MTMIRTIREADASQFIELLRKLDTETPFMMMEAGERLTTADEQRERIKRILSHENQTILVAETDGQVVGLLAAFGGEYRRNKHNAHIAVGVLQAFSGAGIGAALFGEVDRWARQQRLHRLELTVMAHNTRAIRLYTKMGFELEGRRRDSMFVDGVFVDELFMAKLLPLGG